MNNIIQLKQNTIRQYLNKGLPILPCHKNSKEPKIDNWSKVTKVTAEDFGVDDNIGLRNDNTINIDVDNPLVHLHISPVKSQCKAIYGRKSNPESHYVFEGKTKYKKYKAPEGFSKNFEKFSHGQTILEIRSGNGCQDIIPNSTIHDEDVRWNGSYEFVKYNGELEKDLDLIVFKTILTILYPNKGNRDDFCYALGCTLNKYGDWSTEQINNLMYDVAVAAQDDEIKKRLKESYTKNKAKGIPTLTKIWNVKFNDVAELFKIIGINIADELPELKISIYNSEIKFHKRDWAMEKYLMKGKLTLLQGQGGAGKSTTICQLATCFTTGHSFFGNDMKMVGNALLIFNEEDTNEINLKLKACEQIIGKSEKYKIHTIGYDSNLKLVKFKFGGETESTSHYDQLDQYIKDNDIKFIGLDPLISLQLGQFDENSNPQMDNFIKNYLVPLAAENSACLIAAHHTNKISMLTESETSDNAIYSGRGASSLSAAARVVIGVASMSKKLWEDEYKSVLPNENDRHDYVALIDAKNNYAARNNIPTWIKKKQIQIDCENGVEWVNVFEECNLSQLVNKKTELRKEYDKKKILDLMHHISNFFTDEQDYVVSVNSLAAKLTSLDVRLATMKEATLKQEYSRLIKGVFIEWIEYGGFKFKYSFDNHLKNKHNLTKLNINEDRHNNF